MLAECLNEIGSHGESLQFLNQVRRRSGLKDYTIINQENRTKKCDSARKKDRIRF
ncbi:RagB/SusD family nutrient uptake outer membrane protein [Pedobacter sp. NJ-S-72]